MRGRRERSMRRRLVMKMGMRLVMRLKMVSLADVDISLCERPGPPRLAGLDFAYVYLNVWLSL